MPSYIVSFPRLGIVRVDGVSPFEKVQIGGETGALSFVGADGEDAPIFLNHETASSVFADFSKAARLVDDLLAAVNAATPTEPGEEPEEPGTGEPVTFVRVGSSNTAVIAHSGHSLTDAYMHHGPWPGIMASLLVSAGRMENMDYQVRHLKAAVPGSGIRARYEHDIDWFEDQGGPYAFAQANLHDTLMITEAGPPIRFDRPETRQLFLDETMDYGARFVANQIENGRGRDVLLWSIWPHLAGAGATDESPAPTSPWVGLTARQALPIYSYHYRLKADYLTAKMRKLYPSLPANWRVFMIPGHLYMQRVMDDFENGLIPGVTDFNQLMDRYENGDPDGIHPGPWLMYGMSAMVAGALYQFEWSDVSSPWVLPAYTAANGVQHPALPAATAKYMRDLADEINTTYYHVGMGGTVDAEPVWTEADGDLMPLWTLADPNTGTVPVDPEPPVGGLPDDILAQITPTVVTGLTVTPELPAAVDGFRPMTLGHQAPIASAAYVAVRARRETGGPVFATLGTSAQSWNADKLSVAAHGSSDRWVAAREAPNEHVVHYGTATLDTNVHTFEIWYEDGEIHIDVDGGGPVSEVSPAYAAFNTLYLNLYTAGYDLSGLIAMGRVPTAAERAAIRSELAEG